jgi:SlyX protein
MRYKYLFIEDKMEDRITELESRVAFQEQLIDQLNDVVANQDRILLELTAVVKVMGEKINQSQIGAAETVTEEAPPPHY